jgi:hypothetical protein
MATALDANGPEASRHQTGTDEHRVRSCIADGSLMHGTSPDGVPGQCR